VGNSTSFDAEPIMLNPESLLRHVAIVGCPGNGRLCAALNLVEQTLERGVPAILLDRTGEMSGYARPDWWQQSNDPSRARRLAELIDVRLFTPGIRGGRPLSVAVVPDLARFPEADHDRVVRLAAAAVAATMRSDSSHDEPERLAMLTRAIAALARRSASGGLLELSAQIESETHELTASVGDDQLRQRLVEDLVALLGNADVFTPSAESLTAATLIQPTFGGQVPLAIVNTSFLGEGARLRSWIALLVGTVNRELALSKSTELKTLFVLDGADLLLPASSGKASSNDPLQGLIGHASTAGIGFVLVSRSPGDLDYRRCTSINTWLVGKTDEQAVEKMKALLEHRPLGYRNLSRLESGRFVMLREGGARDVEGRAPLIRIEQLVGDELKALAARTRSRSRDASPDRAANAPVDDLSSRQTQPG
jgi:hypothetical protein